MIDLKPIEPCGHLLELGENKGIISCGALGLYCYDCIKKDRDRYKKLSELQSDLLDCSKVGYGVPWLDAHQALEKFITEEVEN